MWQRLREDINCVFDRDPAARNVFEIVTTYPGLHAILFHRLNHALWRRGFKWLARWLSTLARWLTGIEIHPGATLGRRFFIDHGMGVVIGETAQVGDDCTLYHGVTLGGTSWQKGKRHPTLGNNVVVGAGAKVLGPIDIGDNARIGSNSVVVKPVPANATVVGVPGRLVDRGLDPQEQLRREIARKIGFDAYGTTRDLPDPEANAINRMLDHIHCLDRKIEEMCQAMRGAQIDPGDTELPPLETGIRVSASNGSPTADSDHARRP
ncbi:MAG: serine O-acetyltransferase [Candidatus Competibacteraceae bacterium]|nr:serine O-acetyltransferase [Candidatus Competibacteraceae bacterium]